MSFYLVFGPPCDSCKMNGRRETSRLPTSYVLVEWPNGKRRVNIVAKATTGKGATPSIPAPAYYWFIVSSEGCARR